MFQPYFLSFSRCFRLCPFFVCKFQYFIIGFFTTRAYARAVLGVVILSVGVSHAWIVTKLNDAQQIFWYHTKGRSLCYSWPQQRLVGDASFPPKSALKVTNPFEKRRIRQISTYNISTVTDSEKSSIMTNITSTTCFPMSYWWNAYVTPKSRKGGSKSHLFVFLE